MARHKNVIWSLTEAPDAATASLGVLMDIRDELQQLNRTFGCINFLSIPGKLSDIRAAVRRTDKRLSKRIPIRKRQA